MIDDFFFYLTADFNIEDVQPRNCARERKIYRLASLHWVFAGRSAAFTRCTLKRKNSACTDFAALEMHIRERRRRLLDLVRDAVVKSLEACEMCIVSELPDHK
jgi:hypothetical protein